MNTVHRTIKHLMIDHEPELDFKRLASLAECSPRFLTYLLTGRRKSRRISKEVAEILGISTQRLVRLARRPSN